MVKVQGPMFSLAASGSLAGAAVFSTWKGRPYVRQLVKPANPKSPLQVAMRAMFKFLSQNWKNIGATAQDSWITLGDQITASPFNGYMKVNQAHWREFTAPHVTEPQPAADTPADLGAIAAVAGEREITITMPITTENNGWGVSLHRSLTGTFTPSLSNCIQIRPIAGTADVVFVDGPLIADEYFYECRTFSLEGVFGTNSGEASATIT